MAEDMEQRLVALINNSTERLLVRIGQLERRVGGVALNVSELRGEFRDLRSEHALTREAVLALPGQIVGMMEKALLERLRAIEERLARLEPPRERP